MVPPEASHLHGGGIVPLRVHFSYCKSKKLFVIYKGILMHCIKANFDKILHILKEILGEELPASGNLKRPGPIARFTDIEVIALSITAECLSIDSELYLFGKLEAEYKEDFPHLISRRQYNDRRKILFEMQESIRKRLAIHLNEFTRVYAIDSMPLEICKLSRMERNKMGKDESYTAPDKGFCASQNKWFYGYKLHGVCSPNGVIQELDLTKASVHDVHFLKDLKLTMKDCCITGDRGYISQPLAKELKEKNNIEMRVPMRNNQKGYTKVPWIFKKIRKRIETVFSQLCDQFMIQRNYAKSFRGFRTRILAKISGFTTLNYFNKLAGRPLGQIKYALR